MWDVTAGTVTDGTIEVVVVAGLKIVEVVMIECSVFNRETEGFEVDVAILGVPVMVVKVWLVVLDVGSALPAPVKGP